MIWHIYRKRRNGKKGNQYLFIVGGGEEKKIEILCKRE